MSEERDKHGFEVYRTETRNWCNQKEVHDAVEKLIYLVNNYKELLLNQEESLKEERQKLSELVGWQVITSDSEPKFDPILHNQLGPWSVSGDNIIAQKLGEVDNEPSK